MRLGAQHHPIGRPRDLDRICDRGKRQVGGAKVGLAHTLGGNTATVLVSLFGRE